MKATCPRFRRRLAAAIAAVTLTLVAAMGGCTSASDNAAPKGDGKTIVSLLYAGGLDNVKELVESTYDDIEIDFQASTRTEFTSTTERQLLNGQGNDILFANQPSGIVAEHAADLSAYDFSTRYQASIMSSIKSDGRALFLPLPSNYRGVVVNATLLEQAGVIDRPQTVQELLDALRAAKEQGLGAVEGGAVIGIDQSDASNLGHLLAGAAVPGFLGTVEGESWFLSFQEGEAGFGGEWLPALGLFSALADEGLLDVSRIDGTRNVVRQDDLVARMAAGELAAAFGTLELLNEIEAASEGYDFDLLPYPGDESGDRGWVATYPLSYLALNKELEELGNEARLDASLRVLELLSTPEGQRALMRDTRTAGSYLNNFESAAVGGTGVGQALGDGYLYFDRFDADVAAQMGARMLDVMKGSATAEEALAELNRFCEEGPQSAAESHVLVGSVAEDVLLSDYDVRRRETALGNLVADAVAEASGAPIALVNSGGIRESLYKGDVYSDDVARVAPIANEIVVVEMSGRTLLDTLRNSVSALYYKGFPMGRFLQVSGLQMEVRVDASAEQADVPARAEVVSVRLADGSAVEKDGRYTVAVNAYLCGSAGYADGAGDGYAMLNLYSPETAPLAEDVKLVDETGMTYADALGAYFERHRDVNVSPSVEGRIVMEGVPS